MSDRELLTRLGELDGPVEPSSQFRDELRELLDEERQSPTPDSDRPRTLVPARQVTSTGRRIAIALAVFAGVLLVGLGTLWITSGVEEPADTSPPSTTPETLPSTTVPVQTDIDRVIQLPADRYPTAAAFADDRFWVIAQVTPPESGERPPRDVYLMGVDASTGAVDVEVELTDAPIRVAVSESAVWVTHWETGAVSRLDPDTSEVVATIPLQLPFDDFGDERLFVPFDIVIGHGSVWVSTARGAIARIDQESNELLEMYEFESRSLGADLEVGPNGVWVTGDAGGLYHVPSEGTEMTHISLEALDHTASVVFVPGNDVGDSVYVSGDPLERNEEGEFRVFDGNYRATGRSRVTVLDTETLEVMGSTEFDDPIIHLGWVNAFVGALDDRGVFTHLSSIPRLGSQVNNTSWSGGNVIGIQRQAWEIDTGGRRLLRVDETGQAAVDLPFDVEDSVGTRRPVPEHLAVSADWETRDWGPLFPGRASVIWTGEQLVFWGGEALGSGADRTSGAAFTPDTGDWTLLAPSPVPNASEAIWTGQEIVVWSGVGTAAAWTPATNTWRTITNWPLGSGFYQLAVWADGEIIDIGSGVAVEPTTGESRPTARPPHLHERASAVAVDGYVVAVTGEGTYDVAKDRWIEMPASPLTPLAVSGVSIDDAMFAVDYEMKAARYDPRDNTWTQLPDVPLRFYECSPTARALQQSVVVDHCAGWALWDDADGTWTPITRPELTTDQVPTIIPAGDRLFAWGEQFYEFVGDLQQPSRLAVGTSVLDVPNGWTVTSVVGEGDRMDVIVESDAGERCTVLAAHVGAVGFLQSYMTDGTTATQIDPYVGGESVDALAVESGAIDDRHHVVWATGTTDVIDLACGSQAAIDELAPRIWSLFQ